MPKAKFSDSTDIPNGYVIGSDAMHILGLSRHNFERAVEKGFLNKCQEKDTNIVLFTLSEIEAFKETSEYSDMVNGYVDPRNCLNDLTGKEWIPETKSYFYQRGLGASHPHAQIERLHPAPFSFQDVQKLIEFFTKRGMVVLDPFGGVGSTAKACELSGRKCISIELSPKYHELSKRRIEEEVGLGLSANHSFINANSCTYLPSIKDNSIDFIITSPPYWGILNKQDQKVLKNRVANNLDTKYSDSDEDLGNIADYNSFLDILCHKIFKECGRILKRSRYIVIIVSDFRDKGEYISFHSDLIQRLNHLEIPDGGKLYLQGTKILIQNHKCLHPYGYPFSYVENIHHQYVLIFRKK